MNGIAKLRGLESGWSRHEVSHWKGVHEYGAQGGVPLLLFTTGQATGADFFVALNRYGTGARFIPASILDLRGCGFPRAWRGNQSTTIDGQHIFEIGYKEYLGDAATTDILDGVQPAWDRHMNRVAGIFRALDFERRAAQVK